MYGKSVLLICADFPREHEDEFNEWYFREHIPERVVGCPGFLRGRRYEAIYDTPKYLAMYEVEESAALQSPEYLSIISDPDPRSRRMIPLFENPIRTVFSVTSSVGIGEGGVLAILGLSLPPEGADAARQRFGPGGLERLTRSPGILSAHFLEADSEALEHSRKNHLRSGDRVVPAMLIVEAQREQDIRRLRQSALSSELVEALGAREEIFGAFQLLYTLSDR